MLAITGLGRSGTSCLANYCDLLGFSTGGNWYDSINAGRENRDTILINNTISEGYKNGRIDFSELSNSIKSIQNKVIKDPRFTWDCPYIVKLWSKYADDLRFLICHRDFDKVAASKTSTNARELKTADECKERFFLFIERILEKNIPFTILKYPDYINDYDLVYDTLSGFGKLRFDKQEGKKIWEDWVDPSKVHFQ